MPFTTRKNAFPKKDLNILDDQKLVQQKLKDRELWFPLCFLIHECMEEVESSEILDKLNNNFECNKITDVIVDLFKKYELYKKVELEVKKELTIAKDCVTQLGIDSKPIQTLIKYSNL